MTEDTNDDRETRADDQNNQDSRFHPPDPDFDYGGAAEDWTGEPGKAEAVLRSIRQKSVGTDESQPVSEGWITPAGGQRPPKRFLLKEPEHQGAIKTLVDALLSGNHFAVVKLIVHDPEMSRQKWDNDLTGPEQERLWDLCCEFIRADEFVDLAALEEAESRAGA